MLSRLALRSVGEKKICLAFFVRPAATTTTSTDVKSSTNSTAVKSTTSEVRDLVNFPRPKRLIFPGKVRMGFIPDEWFQFFYPKTGVTGPYVFGFSFLTYICSKEIFVMEHEFINGLSLAVMIIFAIKKFGPAVAEYLDKLVEADDSIYHKFYDESVNNIKEDMEHNKLIQWQAQGQSLLFDAKRENIGLQLEAAFRQRLVLAHRQVKRKLDYQLETSNVKTKLEQRHMVNWIVDNVRKSITPALEAATLKQCLGDLKALSAKA